MVTFTLCEFTLPKIYMIIALQVLVHFKKLGCLAIRLLVELSMHQPILDINSVTGVKGEAFLSKIPI